MKKLLLAVGISLGLVATTHAFVIDTDACAGTEYIYDQQGVLVEYDPAVHTFVTAETPVFYAASETIPHLFLHTNRRAHILVRNTANAPVNFFFRPTYYSESTGFEAQLSNETFFGIFSNSNSPLDSAGASMPARSVGRINANSTSTIYQGSAEIYWDSSTCFSTPPMRVSVETRIATNTGGISVYMINNGGTW